MPLMRKPPSRKRTAPYKRRGYGSIARAPARRTSRMTDGTSMLITTYFELTNLQPAVGASTKLAYSIKCDPRNCTLALDGNAVAANAVGTSVTNGTDTLVVTPGATSGDLAFTRFAQFAPLYGQYKLNSVSISTDVSRECGLDNPVGYRTDKEIATPIANTADLMASAHKQYTMTEAKRTSKYGWKPGTTADKEYRNMSQELSNSDAHWLKVFQEIEPHNSGICKHRVTVTMSVSLKDSRSAAVGLN